MKRTRTCLLLLTALAGQVNGDSSLDNSGVHFRNAQRGMVMKGNFLPNDDKEATLENERNLEAIGSLVVPDLGAPQCPGECTFVSMVTYAKNAVDRITGISYEITTEAPTGVCVSEIGPAKGRFQFKRSKDGNNKVTFGKSITALERNGHLDGCVSGSPLPKEVRVRLVPIENPRYMESIEVGANGGYFKEFDIYTANPIACKCDPEGTSTTDELVSRLETKRNFIDHNGGSRSTSGNTVTFKWIRVHTCDTNLRNTPTRDALRQDPNADNMLNQDPC